MPNLGDIVRVTASIRAGGTNLAQFGRTLLVGTGDVLDAGGDGKVRVFSRLSDVAAVFAATSEEYVAAQTYFAQVPRPKNLVIARWARALVTTVLTGGSSPAAAGTLGAISNGSLSLGGVAVTGIDLSSAGSYTAQAAAVQTALRAVGDVRFTNALTVTYANGRFVLDLGTAGDLSGVATTTGSGTDIAEHLGWTAGEGAVYRQGSEAESIADCLDAVEAVTGDWYFFCLEKQFSGTAEMAAASAWAEAKRKMFIGGTHEAGVKSPSDTAAQGSIVAATGRARTALVYSTSPDYKPISIAGRLSSVDFDQPSSLITAKFKTLRGFVADRITPTERDALVGKRVNYYTAFSGTPIFAEGVTVAEGVWMDTQYWLDWLVTSLETSVWNLLRQSDAVPQTNDGLLALRDTITRVLEQGVANGGIAPGVGSADLTLDVRQSIPDPTFDGTLSSGYLLFIGSLAAQTQTDREARQAPPIKVWLKQRGAIHEVAITVTLEA